MEASSLLSSSLLCALLILSNALNDEGLALLSFKTSILEDPSGSLANWNASDRDPCHWNGITCKQSAVVSLSLPKNGLLGSLPSSLGSLASLRHVNLRSNRLSGSLPPGILKPRSLQSLVLFGNSLSGFLPPEVSALSSLQLLDLSHNSMNGSIPVTIVQCRRLRTLVLSHNSFTGSLPLGTGLSALEMFDVSYNRFSGPIPADIGGLRSLDGIADLSHNLFSGPVPASIGELPERVYVDLSYNNLSGPIPRNGSLANRGLSAFVGNPGLCGPPLKSSCMSANVSSVRNGGSVRRRVVIVLIGSDVVAIGLLALAFYCLYRRAILSKGVEEKWESNGRLRRNECLCFGKDELEKFVLIPLDKNVRFDLDELLQATAFVLRKSSTGIVYKVVMDDGLTLAVRRFGEGGQRRFKEFQREVEVIGKLRNANLVALRAYYWSIDEKLLVYDFIPNGNLALALHGRAGGSFSPMSWRVRLQIIKGIANGLAFLHGFSPKRYVHGDLKPSNILLGLKMEPHISNFGLRRLARLTEENTPERPQSQFSDSAVSPVSSHPYYQPPEAFRSVKPSQKWDVYSYGVILLEIISGRSPGVLLDTMEMDLVQWFQFCIEERKPTFDVFDQFLAQEPDMEDEIIAVLKVALACVQFDPERRPSMRHVKDTLERSIARN